MTVARDKEKNPMEAGAFCQEGAGGSAFWAERKQSADLFHVKQSAGGSLGQGNGEKTGKKGLTMGGGRGNIIELCRTGRRRKPPRKNSKKCLTNERR